MTFTLVFSWWWIPALITVSGLIWVFFIYDDGAHGYLSGIGNVLMLIPVLFISMLSWIIAAVLK